jgi:hypothetical protein
VVDGRRWYRVEVGELQVYIEKIDEFVSWSLLYDCDEERKILIWKDCSKKMVEMKGDNVFKK